MSSEYTIHLGDKLIKGQVMSLSPELSSSVVRLTVGGEEGQLNSQASFVLFVSSKRLLELSTLFYELGASLAPETYGPYIPIEDVAEAVDPPHRYG